MDYENSYVRLSKEHEAKQGHMMTKEYQAAIDALENKKQKQINSYKVQIDKLNHEKEEDTVLTEREAIIIMFEKTLKAMNQRNNGALREGLKNLETQVSLSDKELDDTYKTLSSEEQKTFITKRERIKNYSM